jgi:glycosyltransferase involved in cell wall biosynthesis
MPVLDAAATLGAQLDALAGQDYEADWEVVIADNGSTDGSQEVAKKWAQTRPNVRLIDASSQGRGPNHARNAGANAATGDFLAFCDADDVAGPGWLEAMAEAARDADIVGGRLEWEALNDPVVRAWRPQAPMTDLLVGHGFLRYAPGGNMGVWTYVAREIGWDEEFTFGSSDHGFAWRAQLAGYRLAFAPDAVMQQRFRSTLGAMARQHFRYGRSGPQLHRAFRNAGLPDPDNRDGLRDWRTLAATVPDLWASREHRGRWIRTASFRVGRLAGSLQARVLCL